MGIVQTRHTAVLKIVSRTGTARLADLANEIGVSMATIRRDAAALERVGRLHRRHGSVELLGSRPSPRVPVGAVGMLVSRNRYLELIAQAARREAERRNLQFLLEHVEPGSDTRAATRRLMEAGCIGLIYSPQWPTSEEMNESVPWLQTLPVPLLLAGREVGREHPLFMADSVIADHAYALQLALDHLCQLGHRRVLASIRSGSPPSSLLRRRFDAEIARRGLPRLAEPFATPLVTGLWTHADSETDQSVVDPAGADGFAPLVRQVTELGATAVVVHTDDAAQLLIHLLRSAGIQVPGQCSVVGYDDIIGPVDGVTLTSVSPPKHQLGVEAVSLLLRRHLRSRAGLDRPPVAHVRLLPELVVRGSTAPPPA